MVKIVEKPPVFEAWQYKGGDPFSNESLPHWLLEFIPEYTKNTNEEYMEIIVSNTKKYVKANWWIILKNWGKVEVVSNTFFHQLYSVVPDPQEEE